MAFLDYAAMSKRLNWERNTLARKAQYGLSVKDESDYLSRDFTAKWIDRHEKHAERVQRWQRRKQQRTQPPRVAESFDDIDPTDSHHQLAGVDMKRPPW
jgi:hypothetical protein